jgi:hypothetical protein
MDFLLKIKWRPGIGDPTPAGWFTVVVYGVAAVLAWRLWSKRRERVWLGVAVLMAFLCWNKQFDFQSLLTDLGREIARHGGWYEDRRRVQKGLVLAVLAGAGVFGGWFVWRFRGFLGERKLLAAGCFLLLTFIVVRAISFHHVDAFLKSGIAGMRMNWLLELGGISLVILAAIRELALSRPTVRSGIREG